MSRDQNWSLLILRFPCDKKNAWLSEIALYVKYFYTMLEWYSKPCRFKTRFIWNKNKQKIKYTPRDLHHLVYWFSSIGFAILAYLNCIMYFGYLIMLLGTLHFKKVINPYGYSNNFFYYFLKTIPGNETTLVNLLSTLMFFLLFSAEALQFLLGSQATCSSRSVLVWNTLTYTGIYRNILEYTGIYWQIKKYNQMY